MLQSKSIKKKEVSESIEEVHPKFLTHQQSVIALTKDVVCSSTTSYQQYIIIVKVHLFTARRCLEERGLLPPDTNEEIQIFTSPTIKHKSTTTRPICYRPGCTALTYIRGLCKKHRYPCIIEGCMKQAQVGGYCRVHAKEHDPDAYDRLCSQLKLSQICKVEGCEKQVKAGGYCSKHAKEYNPKAYDRLRNDRSCKVDGCNKHVQAGGYCIKHAKKHKPEAYNRLRSDQSCASEGSNKLALVEGFCIEHAKEHDLEAYDEYVANTSCKVKGCTKQAKAGGYCITHAKEHDPDAYNRLRSDQSCAIKTCKQAKAGGFCIEHSKEYDPDAYKKLTSDQSCEVEGYMKQAQAGGYCIQHAKEHDPNAYDEYLDRIRSDQSCAIGGCIKHAVVGQYCSEHAQKYSPISYRKFRDQVNKSKANRWNNDHNFRIKENIRNYIREALKKAGKSEKGKVKKYLGCTVNQLREYFELNHFQEEDKKWMNWDKHGGGRCNINRSWEFDHIMPVSSFDLSYPEQVKKCFHWSNLQPLKWQDNAEKSGSIPENFEWCYEKQRWMWSEASKINYELPQV